MTEPLPLQYILCIYIFIFFSFEEFHVFCITGPTWPTHEFCLPAAHKSVWRFPRQTRNHGIRFARFKLNARRYKALISIGAAWKCLGRLRSRNRLTLGRSVWVTSFEKAQTSSFQVPRRFSGIPAKSLCL